MSKPFVKSGVVCLLFFLFLSVLSCRYTSGEDSARTSASEDGMEDPQDDSSGRGPATGGHPRQNIIGFGGWGGIAKSERYVHISDPSAIVSADPLPEGQAFSGGVGLNPELIVPLGLTR